MGASRWGTRGTRPPTFSDSGDLICHVPPHFLFRFRNILVSHQTVPPHFATKLRSCPESYANLIIRSCSGNIQQANKPHYCKILSIAHDQQVFNFLQVFQLSVESAMMTDCLGKRKIRWALLYVLPFLSQKNLKCILWTPSLPVKHNTEDRSLNVTLTKLVSSVNTESKAYNFAAWLTSLWAWEDPQSREKTLTCFLLLSTRSHSDRPCAAAPLPTIRSIIFTCTQTVMLQFSPCQVTQGRRKAGVLPPWHFRRVSTGAEVFLITVS